MSRKARGLFVTLEGPEGAGKTTQMGRLVAFLEAAKVPVVRTREPGGTPAAEGIRHVLIGQGAGEMDPRCELLLMLAARADHAAGKIAPALAEGRLVLCDRYMDSSVAYQGAARGLGVATVEELNAFATHGVVPDLTLVLDIDPERGLARAKARGHDRIEAAGLAFHRKVRKAFLDLAAREPRRFVVVDGDRDEALVFADLVAALAPRIKRRLGLALPRP